MSIICLNKRIHYCVRIHLLATDIVQGLHYLHECIPLKPRPGWRTTEVVGIWRHHPETEIGIEHTSGSLKEPPRRYEEYDLLRRIIKRSVPMIYTCVHSPTSSFGPIHHIPIQLLEGKQPRFEKVRECQGYEQN